MAKPGAAQLGVPSRWGSSRRNAQLEAVVDAGGEECLAAALDVTNRKRLEEVPRARAEASDRARVNSARG